MSEMTEQPEAKPRRKWAKKASVFDQVMDLVHYIDSLGLEQQQKEKLFRLIQEIKKL